MTDTKPRATIPGDGNEAATWGGPGWRPRARSHAEEIGNLWQDCGVRSEVSELRAVLLSWPGDEMTFSESPNTYLMLDRVDLARLQQQARAVQSFFASNGVAAHMYVPSGPPPPNHIFMRDLFFMTPQGAIVGRVAAQQRAGEERFAAEALAQLGVPILRTLTGRATFEGADALFVDPSTVLIGSGRRTNDEGVAAVTEVLSPQGIAVRTVTMPEGVQHLLGVANCVDRNLVVVHGGKASDALRGVLREHGYEVLELPPTEELTVRRGMNFVTLGPRRLVMPAGCPGIRRRYADAGIDAQEVDVSEYIKGAGALGCLTGILHRAS